jgi:hypothetical protein
LVSPEFPEDAPTHAVGSSEDGELMGNDGGPRRPVTPEIFAARISAARSAPSEIQRIRRLLMATGDLTLEEIPQAVAFANRTAVGGEEQEILKMTVLARWAELDPPAAAAYAFEQVKADRGMANQAMEIAIGEWAVRDASAAAEFVAGLEGSKRDTAIGALLGGVAGTQPEMAFALLARFPEAAEKRESYRAIFNAWSSRDPASAAARAATLPAGENRSAAMDTVAQRWAERDPVTAYARAAQLGEPAERESALKTTLRSWANRDPQAAAGQALALADAGVLREVADDIARQMAQGDLGAAKTFAAQLSDEGARAGAQQAVAMTMLGTNVAEAAAYAGQMAEGDSRRNTFYTVSASWFQKDPVAAAQWLETLPRSGSRDSAVQAYVERAAPVDGETAMEWAASIGDENKRTQAQVRGYQAWEKKSPQAAKAWLAADQTISNEVKTKMKTAPQPR